MGIASLILGIIGFLVSLTLFKDLSLIVSVIGLVLGIIAIIKKKNKKVLAQLDLDKETLAHIEQDIAAAEVLGLGLIFVTG